MEREDESFPPCLFPNAVEKLIQRGTELGDIELLSGQAEAVLVIDEVQKVRNWSRMIKREWDALNYRPLFCFDDVLCGLLCRQVVEI